MLLYFSEKYNNNCCTPSHKVKKARLVHIACWAERYVQYGTFASTTITMHRVAKCHRYQRYIHAKRYLGWGRLVWENIFVFVVVFPKQEIFGF